MRKIFTILTLTGLLAGGYSVPSVQANDNFEIGVSFDQTQGKAGALVTYYSNFNDGDFSIGKFENVSPYADPLDTQEQRDFFGQRTSAVQMTGTTNLNHVSSHATADKKIYNFIHNHTSDNTAKFTFAGVDKSKMNGDEVKVTIYKGNSKNQVLESSSVDANGNQIPVFNKEIIPVDIKGDLDSVAGLEKAEFTIKPGESKKITKADFKPANEKASEENKTSSISETSKKNFGLYIGAGVAVIILSVIVFIKKRNKK